MEGKTPPAQVAEGQEDWAPALIGMQRGTTMNASTVLVLVEWHKLEQDAATGMQLALGHYVNRVLLAQTLYLNSG